MRRAWVQRLLFIRSFPRTFGDFGDRCSCSVEPTGRPGREHGRSPARAEDGGQTDGLIGLRIGHNLIEVDEVNLVAFRKPYAMRSISSVRFLKPFLADAPNPSRRRPARMYQARDVLPPTYKRRT